MKIQKNINVWWSKAPQPGNFGDILTPLIIENLFDHKCVFAQIQSRTPTLLGVGSIISKAVSNTVVWGSGMMKLKDPLKRDATYLAVRGPITHESLIEQHANCPPVFGDPALLMPKIYKPTNVNKKYEYGLFAHYVDHAAVSKWYGTDPQILVINPLHANPLHVIDLVCQCKRIISSSLHGVIIAHAYGIPAVWARHSDKLDGDGTKFKDYFYSVKLIPECVDFKERINPNDLGKFNYQVDIQINLTPLMASLRRYLDEQHLSNHH